jgi:beta-phosphoglucomutase-like phosphatase (HAD superfamily)
LKPPPLPSQIDVLSRVLERIGDHPDPEPPPLVVFDLDGTLFDNRARTLQILMEYAAEIEGELPDVARALSVLTADEIHYLLSDTLRGVGLTRADDVRDISQYWHGRFFSDDYLHHDLACEGAAEYVNQCHEAGATVIYLTGRDVAGMLLGTVASLRDHGFPIGKAGVELVLKPDANLADEAFKRMALPTLARTGRMVGFFDNEPANCNTAIKLYPDADVVLLETQRVDGAPECDDGIHRLVDFRVL